MPPIIDVSKSFRFAIGGNKVIEYPVGAHGASDEVVDVATKQLKSAKVVKTAKKILPSIIADINGEDLGDENRHLDLSLIALIADQDQQSAPDANAPEADLQPAPDANAPAAGLQSAPDSNAPAAST